MRRVDAFDGGIQAVVELHTVTICMVWLCSRAAGWADAKARDDEC